MNGSLLNLTDRFLEMHDRIAESHGELDEQTTAELNEMLSKASEGLETKIDGIANLIKEFEYRADVRKQEADRMANRAKVDRNAAKRLKDYLCMALDTMGQTGFETEHHKVTVCNAGGKRRLIIPEDWSEVPEAHWNEFVSEKVVVEIDQTVVRRALDDGRQLPFARYAEPKRTLRLS